MYRRSFIYSFTAYAEIGGGYVFTLYVSLTAEQLEIYGQYLMNVLDGWDV